MNVKPFFSAASEHWSTPREVFESLNSEFRFNFDPCPLHADFDGLASDWRGRRIFCNPPYGPKIREWLLRGLDAEVAVFLLPVRTDTRWFHEIVIPHHADLRFVKGRLRFGDSKTGAPFPSMVVVFGDWEAPNVDPPAGSHPADYVVGEVKLENDCGFTLWPKLRSR